MSRSFLAMFRGADARSIGHALAILLVFNAFLGAFHSGAMAKGANGEVILCNSDGAVRASDGLPQEPADAEDMSCCVLGCGPSPVAITAEPALFAAPAYQVSATSPLLVESLLCDLRRAGGASPRGPPILA
jgi:hypothetical protein